MGIRRENGKIVGDIENTDGIASFRTPVPGGIGPLTVTMLTKNVVNQWLRSKNI